VNLNLELGTGTLFTIDVTAHSASPSSNDAATITCHRNVRFRAFFNTLLGEHGIDEQACALRV